MGPLGGDELNLVERGKNYGWPEVSDGDNYDDSQIPDHPARTWTPVISPSGAVFYAGALFPAWRRRPTARFSCSLTTGRATCCA